MGVGGVGLRRRSALWRSASVPTHPDAGLASPRPFAGSAATTDDPRTRMIPATQAKVPAGRCESTARRPQNHPLAIPRVILEHRSPNRMEGRVTLPATSVALPSQMPSCPAAGCAPEEKSTLLWLPRCAGRSGT
eukprot:TRINITY_DN54653_c0_g1_i1.p3 TRINITY_DN54653_c0_g1~~TRINITY_DN54653_c0_g1_i1.p3  ORF type:complete len:134 (-),score=10.84 TRINITY_DN54653_c0_g1_i1:52-453(-)